MANLEQLRKVLEAEAEGESARLLTEARQRAQGILAQAEAKAHQLREEMLARTASEAEVWRRQTEAEERLLRRQALLEAKAQLLGQVADAAKQAVAALPEQEYLLFLVRLVAAAEVRGDVRVILNERDSSRLGERLVAEAAKALSARGCEARLSLAPEIGALAGGVKLSGSDFEIDCSLERLLDLAAEELEPEVARILFA